MEPPQAATGREEGKSLAPSGEASSTSRGIAEAMPGINVSDHQLIQRIGAGSYGEVWLARSVLGQLRAVKLVYRSRFNDERPFEREFEGIERFEPISRSHPSQLAILHVGRNEEAGCFYYVMELADAVSNPKPEAQNPKEVRNPKPERLAEIRTSDFGLLSDFGLRPSDFYVPHTLRWDLEQRGRLPITECVQIGLSLTTALAHLHQHGLVHRDIKPSNVLFVNGAPKLGDIGLVTDAGDTHSIVGTEGYIPPEGPGAPQADIFSLGKVLYEVSTGMDRRRFSELPEDLRLWPDRSAVVEFNEIVLKACAKDPARRYKTAEGMYADLALLKSGQSVKRLRTVERRLKNLTKAAVVGGVCAVIGAGIFFETLRQRQIALRSLVRLHVANGKISMDNGDLFGSLLSFTEALRRDAGNAKREESHRIRVASVLRECPKLIGLFAHSNAPINDAAFSPDSRRLVTASDDHTAQVWDLATGERQFSLLHRGMVFSAVFSPNSQRLATTSSDNLVHMWSVTNGDALRQSPITHRGQISGPHPRFSPQGERLLTLTDASTVRIWNSLTGEALGQPLRHEQAVTSIAFSPEGRRILTLSDDHVARLWDAFTGEAAGPVLKNDTPVNCGAFSPDGRILAIGGDDYRVRFWDLLSGTVISRTLILRQRVESVEFSPEGSRLATASKDGTVELWDVATGAALLPPLLHEQKVFRADFSPDGRWLATSSEGNRVRLWDADTGKMLAPPFVHNTPRGPALFSPDGHLVLTVRRDMTVGREEVAVVWSLARLEPSPLPIRPTSSFVQSAYSANRRFKATISGDTIRTLEVGSGKPLMQPLTQTLPFRQAYFSRDNAVIVTESVGGRGQVWDVSRGEPLTPLVKIRYEFSAQAPTKAELPLSAQPIDDLILLAQLLSGNQIDETGGSRPVDKAALMDAWNKLRRKYPEAFTTSASELFAWHDQAAEACEQAWNWESAIFHLKFLAETRPWDQKFRRRQAYAQEALDRAKTNLMASGYLERRHLIIPPRNPLASDRMVDLSRYYNSSKRIGDDSLEALPSGLQTFDGIEFDVRGVVQLSGPNGSPIATFSDEVLDIRVEQKCQRLHFLQAAGLNAEDGTDVMTYVIHYADNRWLRVTFVYGHHVRSWRTAPNEPLSTDEAVPAWLGSDSDVHFDKAPSLRIFKSGWTNPWPDEEVTSVDFLSNGRHAGPFLVAITAE